MKGTVTFERGEFLYIVGPVAPIELGDQGTTELAFASELAKFSPNESLGWLQGRYVEAERANRNGMIWSADELAIKTLSPRFMPVTVQHDMRSAVGMIADTKLVEAAGTDTTRIDTTLGIWKHRFDDVWAEILDNYQASTLMQSMECQPAYYDCMACDQRFPKLPRGAESANWCAHLAAKRTELAGAVVTTAARRLGNVTFTGSGLIFGTRGSRGAYDDAQLDLVAEEVAEFHERSKHPAKPKPKQKRGVMEIEDRDYQALLAAQAERDQLRTKVTDLTETAAKVPQLEKDLEAEQIAKKSAETDRDTAKAEADALKETNRSTELASTRLGTLGAGFKAKLPEAVMTRLTEQAKSMTDEDWTARLEDLAAMANVPVDDKGDGSAAAGDEFTAAQIAASGTTSTPTVTPPAVAQRAAERTVVGQIFDKLPA